MPRQRKTLPSEDTRFHGVRWDKARWERIKQATRRLQARQSPLRVTSTDVIRMAVDAWLERDEAATPEQLAS